MALYGEETEGHNHQDLGPPPLRPEPVEGGRRDPGNHPVDGKAETEDRDVLGDPDHLAYEEVLGDEPVEVPRVGVCQGSRGREGCDEPQVAPAL